MKNKLSDWQMQYGPKYTDSTKTAEAMSHDVIVDLKALGYIQ